MRERGFPYGWINDQFVRKGGVEKLSGALGFVQELSDEPNVQRYLEANPDGITLVRRRRLNITIPHESHQVLVVPQISISEIGIGNRGIWYRDGAFFSNRVAVSAGNVEIWERGDETFKELWRKLDRMGREKIAAIVWKKVK